MHLRWAIVAAAAVTASAAAVGTAGDVGKRSFPAGSRHSVERSRVFKKPATARCEGDSCAIPILVTVPLRTPDEVARIDVVATASVTFRTRRTTAEAALSILPRPTGGASPGIYPLGGAARYRTQTVVWIRRGLAAGGRRYVFQLTLAPGSAAARPGPISVSTKRLAVVVTSSPAGD
jgi:hypothetical protein